MYAVSGSTAASSSGATLPPDERLAEPETRYEVFGGELYYVFPADEHHAHAHSGLDYLLNAHVADGFLVAVDMLTRTSRTIYLHPTPASIPLLATPATPRPAAASSRSWPSRSRTPSRERARPAERAD